MKSKIEWTDQTWNPTTGCSKVSEGCRNCYAEKRSARFASTPGKYLGVTTNGKFNGTLRLHDDVLDIPLRRRKPTMYFVNSMSDLFHEKVPFEFIDRVFAVMALTPQHTFQILTKRPERMAEYMGRDEIWEGWRDHMPGADAWQKRERQDRLPEPIDGSFYLPNVWLGTSVEDQKSADERVPHLLRCPAAVRFLSVEPLLGALNLEVLTFSKGIRGTCLIGAPNAIDWVIAGGESGPGARPCDVEWIRSIIAQCKAADVPCFVKQDSGPRPGMQGRLDDATWRVKEFPCRT